MALKPSSTRWPGTRRTSRAVIVTVLIAAVAVVGAFVVINGQKAPSDDQARNTETSVNDTPNPAPTTGELPVVDDGPQPRAQLDQTAEDIADSGMFLTEPESGQIDPAALGVMTTAAELFFDVDPRRDQSTSDAAERTLKLMTPARAKVDRHDIDTFELTDRALLNTLAENNSLVRVTDIEDAGRPYGSPPDTDTKITRALLVTWEHVSQSEWLHGTRSASFTFTLVRSDAGWRIDYHDLLFAIPTSPHWSVHGVEGE